MRDGPGGRKKPFFGKFGLYLSHSSRNSEGWPWILSYLWDGSGSDGEWLAEENENYGKLLKNLK